MRALAVEPHTAGLHIEELLICSDRREVYYERHCTEMAKRLSLIEFITHTARQLGHGLPLGKFDRIEMQSATGRATLKSQRNRFVLVRSNTPVLPPAAAEPRAIKTVLEWLAQQSSTRGLLAYGVSLPDRKVLALAFAPDIALTALNTALLGVTDTFDAATRLLFPAWQLRWIYERAQIYCVHRADGANLSLLLKSSRPWLISMR